MKIIQSFWSGGRDMHKEGFGWLSPLDNLLSWTLSCLQLRQFYDDVTLVTDNHGYDILINQLHLPYTDTIVCLDELNKYNSDLWALAKIKAYSLMQEPFIHVDGDVFIFEPIHNELQDHDLIVQNEETTTEYYRRAWNKIKPYINHLPAIMQGYDANIFNKAYNMGIFGGNDIDFIQAYCKTSFAFVDENLPTVNTMQDANFNIFFEQVLLRSMVEEHHKKVATYIKEDIGDNQYKHFADFDEVPEKRKYLHCLGFYKSTPIVNVKIQTFILNNYPRYYRYIERVLNIYPKLEDMNIGYSNNSVQLAIEEYKTRVKDGKLNKYNRFKRILLRDLNSHNNVKLLSYYLSKKINFKLYTTSNFRILKDCIKIYENFENDTELVKLRIDGILFNLIGKCSERKSIEQRAIDYLNEDFPKERFHDFVNLLWKRISILTSHGVIYIE